MRWALSTLRLLGFSLLCLAGTAAHTWQVPLFSSAPPAREPWSPALSFAVAYYPTQWAPSQWASDARRMAAAGIRFVRLAEFDWALLEPRAGTFNFSTLDAALHVLDSHGLQVILGTPTATPPRWAVREYDILGADADGKPRRWGSRRSYSFSAPDYRMLSERITNKLAQRYGQDRRVVAWQLDNEFGCHNTVRTFDAHAAAAFRAWLRTKYGSLSALNEKQGRVFWSSQFEQWADVSPPTHEVTESNPAHRLDWFAFSSHQVAAFAKGQVDVIRKHARQPITTNVFGSFEFDHHAFAQETGLDFVTYPLGYTESTPWVAETDKRAFARTGRPDAQSLHHAIYRGVAGAAHGVARGEWGGATFTNAAVMEQQPGPVNWASHNPSPAPGMVRLWLHEIFAHGGSLANIFRWRQVPYGQEQMHAAMLRPDSVEDVAWHEQQRTREDLLLLRQAGLVRGQGAELQWSAAPRPAKVALVLDYTAGFVLEASPQGGVWQTETFHGYDFQLPELLTEWYSALRRLALDVDVISPATSLQNYSLVVVPTMPKVSHAFEAQLAAFKGHVIFGPRSASKVDTLSLPHDMPPAQGGVRSRLPMKVVRVESLRKGLGDQVAIAGGQDASDVDVWSEWLECERDGEKANQEAPARYIGYRNGSAAACEHVVNGSRTTYLGWYARSTPLLPLFASAARALNISTLLARPVDAAADLGAHVRLARRGDVVYAFNYAMQAQRLPHMPKSATLVVGNSSETIEAAGVSVWHLP